MVLTEQMTGLGVGGRVGGGVVADQSDQRGRGGLTLATTPAQLDFPPRPLSSADPPNGVHLPGQVGNKPHQASLNAPSTMAQLGTGRTVHLPAFFRRPTALLNPAPSARAIYPVSSTPFQ